MAGKWSFLRKFELRENRMLVISRKWEGEVVAFEDRKKRELLFFFFSNPILEWETEGNQEAQVRFLTDGLKALRAWLSSTLKKNNPSSGISILVCSPQTTELVLWDLVVVDKDDFNTNFSRQKTWCLGGIRSSNNDRDWISRQASRMKARVGF